MLIGKQKRYLKKLAHHLQPIMQIGKNGISDSFIETFNEALYSHELIKVSVLQNCLENKNDLAKELTNKTECELVQIIGNQMVFYKQSDKEDLKDKIILPSLSENMDKLTVDKAIEIAKNKDESRFSHVYSTYEKAVYLAKKHHIDEYKCAIAAIFHDYAKNEPYEKMVNIIETHLDKNILKYNKIIFHGEVGAYLVRHELGIIDDVIINAIKYHVTGHPNMDDVAKIIYIADRIEDNRSSQPDIEFCRYLSEISLDLAVLGCAASSYNFLINSNTTDIHPLTKKTYDKYMEKVGKEYDVIKNRYESL